LVRDINPANCGSLPTALVESGGLLYFLANALSDLWASDGSEQGTRLLKTFRGARALVGTDRGVFFIGDDGVEGPRFWVSDGTTDGTRPYLSAGAPHLTPTGGFIYSKGVVYCAATDGQLGAGLWQTDGTAEGTSLLWSGPGTLAEAVNSLAVASEGVVFLVQEQTWGDLWAVGGSTPAPRVLASQQTGVTVNPSNPQLTAVDGTVYFVASDAEHGEELWRTDGTVGGTRMVTELMPGAERSSVIYPLAELYGRLLFVGQDEAHGGELWTSDGTAEGTHVVADIWPGPGGSWPTTLREGPDGRVYFSAFEPEHGRQLWRTDFTAEGTQLVREIAPYPDDIELLDGATAGRTFYFSFRCVPGLNLTCPRSPTLAVTRGTAATTQVLRGPEPPLPWLQLSNLTSAGGCLFFSGYDPLHGWELRRVCDSTPRDPRGRLRSER
jgi:ELWxxDGT repeat protein